MRVMLFLVLVFGAATLAESQEAPTYLVGAGDVLRVTVWGHDSLSRTDAVSPQGTLAFPLIGEIPVAGLTTAQAEARIRELLDRDYIIDPRVSIAVQEYRSQRVFVLGEVAKPGVYPLTGSTSLLDVLSQAGAQTAAAGGSIMVTRAPAANSAAAAGTGEMLRVNLRRLLDGDPASNLRLQHGDTVFVPRIASFFVLGEVQRQGAFALERETTVLDAISLAGGITGRAAPRGAKILRKQPDGPLTTIELDLSGPDSHAREVPLKDGDTLLIPAGDLFFVLGEVAKPGAFALVGATTVIDSVLLAGGFTPRAVESKVKVTRRLPTGEEQVMVLDLSVPNSPGRDIPLMAGDTVMVPTGTGATVYVLGEVKSPGAFPLQDGATTIQAIALAGGFTERAAAGRVRIIRTREDGKQEILVMDANDIIKRGRKDKDVPLAANDVIVVPERLF